MPSSSQQLYYAALIPQLAEPFRNFDWQFSGFSKWVKEALSTCVEDLEDDLEDDTTAAEDVHVHFIPDGFFADPETRMAFVLEVVDTNDVDNTKARAIADCFWLLDRASWQLACVLFYPKYTRTMLVWDLMFLNGYATHQFKDRRNPYRDAFTVLRRDAGEVVVAVRT